MNESFLPPDPSSENDSRIRSLLVYSYYRLFIALSLFGAFMGRGTLHAFSVQQVNVYFYSVVIYLLCCFASVLIVHFRPRANLSRHAFIQACTDIIILTLLMYSSGEPDSNLSVLMVVTVAASNILVLGRPALFIAALAALSVLLEQFYYALNNTSIKGLEFFQTGILGITFFATALITQQLTKRLRESEDLAKQRGSDLVELEQLNHLIIQRMRTGIIVINENGFIHLINDAARHLLNITPGDIGKSLLPPRLLQELQHWQHNHDYRCPIFRTTTTSPNVLCNFTHLKADGQSRVLIFIEDQSQLAQQAQQMKLASLGTLTAGIAHEIRNPLGAISHAAQLLQESSALNPSDIRLAEIIQRHSLRMNSIIENVLQLSRRKISHFERLDLNLFLQHFITEFKQTYETPVVIHLKSPAQPLVTHVDPNQLTQILTNLCQNGLRYSQEHTGNAEIMLISGKLTHNDRPYIDVIDQGPGIPPGDAEHIFEPFFTTRATGTGLGLYLAKELCEANESSLNYIPLNGQGSCFRITFSHPERISTRQASSTTTLGDSA